MLHKKILVTGVNGFVGKHLTNELNSRGVEVVGVGMDLHAHQALANSLSSYIRCDLTDDGQVKQLPLEEISAVISLAGLAKVGDSFNQPDLYKHVNVAVLSVLGEQLLARESSARVVAISTGAVYDSGQPMPLTESSKLITAGSPYAFSKIAMEQEAMRLRDLSLNTVVVRPFNHIGPGQEGGFLVPDLYAKIQAALKSDKILSVGNLTTKRDYTDVRDVVKAYADLALAPKLSQPIYNVCSGRSVAGETILELLLQATDSSGKITTQLDKQLIREDDPRELFGSNKRLRAETGWQPTIPTEQTIKDYVQWQQNH